MYGGMAGGWERRVKKKESSVIAMNILLLLLLSLIDIGKNFFHSGY